MRDTYHRYTAIHQALMQCVQLAKGAETASEPS